MPKGVDLSGLDSFNSSSFLEENILAGSDGKPLMIPIDKIQRDPDQPRVEFDMTKLAELSASITERGVKSPISVRRAGEDTYIINHGERRLRAAKMAGHIQIPAFIDDDHSNFDQVIENIQREDLTPLEIAHFIERRLEAGDKKGDIAKLLGKPASFVSDHSVFSDLADAIRELYDSGRCRSVQSLALLHRAYKDFAAQVTQYCKQESNTFSQAEIRAFIAGLKKPAKKAEEAAQEEQTGPGADASPEEDKETGLKTEQTTENEESPLFDAPGDSAPHQIEEEQAGPGAGSDSKLENQTGDTDTGEDDLLQAQKDLFESYCVPVERFLKETADPDFKPEAIARLQAIIDNFAH